MGKNVKVGIELEQEKIVYQNRGLNILECGGVKPYRDEELAKLDNIYRIEINGRHQPTIDDLCELVYYIMMNKKYDKPFYEYKNKIISAINKADKDRKIKYNTGIENWM